MGSALISVNTVYCVISVHLTGASRRLGVGCVYSVNSIHYLFRSSGQGLRGVFRSRTIVIPLEDISRFPQGAFGAVIDRERVRTDPHPL